MIFTDAYERTIDTKNRIQIPAEYRHGLDPEINGDAFYLCPGERRSTLSLYPTKVFERRVASIRTHKIPGDESLSFEQLFYSLASRLELDKQGRVILPSRMLEMVGLGKEVTLAGANDRIDVWNTAEYQEFVKTNYEQRWQQLQRFLRPADSEWKENQE